MRTDNKKCHLPFVRAFDNGGISADRYLITLGEGHSWLMSEDADMPNGVCIYDGIRAWTARPHDRPIDFVDLPLGARKQIQHLQDESTY